MKTTRTSSTSTFSVSAVATLLLLCCVVDASAKRGCSAFGHSCFGGHGKRSDPIGVDETLQETVPVINENSYDAPSEGGEVLLAGPGQIFQDRPMPRSQALAVSPQQHTRYILSPFIRQWLASYLRANGADLDLK